MKTILPFLPERPPKPRNSGLTMVMDKGLSIREAEDFMSVGSRYTDFVKLGFGTSVITPGLKKKIRIYKEAGVCLLYTSDAADEEDSVDLGGRRIIKKK